MSKEILVNNNNSDKLNNIDLPSADFEHLVEKFNQVNNFELDLSVKESIHLKNSITPAESDNETDSTTN